MSQQPDVGDTTPRSDAPVPDTRLDVSTLPMDLELFHLLDGLRGELDMVASTLEQAGGRTTVPTSVGRELRAGVSDIRRASSTLARTLTRMRSDTDA